MSTTKQQQTIPAGFRTVVHVEDGDELTTIEGPTYGGVSTYLDNRDGGIVVSVDGYEKDLRTGMDMTPTEARRLVRDLSRLVESLDELAAPEVEQIARELHARGKRATVDELGQRSHDAGVSVVAVMAAYDALARA